MSRPAFQFYPADWRRNANLRRCSEAARGAWMDVLCVLHDSDEYGVVRWPLKELIRAAGIARRSAMELIEKDVLKGADANAPDYVWQPTHAGRKGDPVVLVVAGEGPCWYSTRLVRDEYVRQRRGQSTRFGEDEGPSPRAPKKAPKTSPKPPIGDGSGDGPSSASASASSSTPCSSNHTGEIPSAHEAGALVGVFEGHEQVSAGDNDAPPARFNRVPVDDDDRPTYGQAAIALRRVDVNCTSHDPDLIAAIDAGVTVQHLVELALTYPGKPIGYIAKPAIRQHQERIANAGKPVSQTTSRGHSHAADQPRESLVDRTLRKLADIPGFRADEG